MIATNLSQYEIWFLTGSQHLYGSETLDQVRSNTSQLVNHFNANNAIPIRIVDKTIATTSEEISAVCQDANHQENCIGLIVWMHTFSPAKMWINGMSILHKPFAHLHTQFNSAIPWETIDMDFMNLNQSAHGDREFGFMMTRMRKNRKVVVGHWQDERVLNELGNWSRVVAGWHALNNLKLARIGDNMRDVAVTDGDKVEAQMKFGFSVNGYGLGDVVKFVDAVDDKEINQLLEEYLATYHISPDLRGSDSLKEAARIEIGLTNFLVDGGFGAFTTTFENLHGLRQLPGISVQRLMEKGFGFGGEGDWKTAALLRSMKVMSLGLEGGTSFMEDYTYHIDPNGSSVLGSHMLEICPSIANGKPSCEVHALGIGGKEDPARLVFDVGAGPAINASLIDMGNRFRLLVNEVDALDIKQPLPKLPVARVLWDPKPNFYQAAEAWILSGGAHHTVFSKTINTRFMEDFAEIAGIELVVIDDKTEIRNLKHQLQVGEIYYNKLI